MSVRVSRSAQAIIRLFYLSFIVNMQLCPTVIPSVASTGWQTNKMKGGPTDGMYEYPDITNIDFGSDGNTSYIRNGKIITYTPPDLQALLYHYTQVGPKVYFAGWRNDICGYACSPSGKTSKLCTNNLLVWFAGTNAEYPQN